MPERLEHAGSAERATILLAHLQEHPSVPLNLAGGAAHRVQLAGVDLSRDALERQAAESTEAPVWWNADLQGIRLQGANLQGADLRLANLQGADLRLANLRNALCGEASFRGAVLEQADLAGADLAGADLRDAILGEANFEGAMLEDARLQGSSLRFAQMQDAVLEQANLQDADLWSATLRNAILVRADLQKAELAEADLRGAQLQGARLNDAHLQGANLEGAQLQGAKLQNVDLSDCNIRHVFLARASLSRTELRQDQLGGAIGEELAKDYEGANQGYLVLERNFAELGDVDASSWAYRRRRRMQTKLTRRQAGRARAAHDWQAAIALSLAYLGQRFVEWLCDYGESASRVLRATLSAYLLFTLIYLAGGMLGRPGSGADGPVLVPTRNLLDVAVYSLTAMTTAGFVDIGLQPTSRALHIISGLEGVVLMILAGLFGFVVGNKIRR